VIGRTAAGTRGWNVTLTEASESTGPPRGVATVAGQERSAADVAAELMDVLVDEPRLVECDLTGMAAEGSAIVEAFTPVGTYLAHWPGTMVMVHAPDPTQRADVCSAAFADRMHVHASWDAGAAGDHMLPHLQRRHQRLTPVSTAPRDARNFTAQVLVDWQVPHLVGAANQVVSELVSHALDHSVSRLDLTLSRVDDRVRLAVRDDGVPPGNALDDIPQSPLSGAGLRLMQVFAEHWDVVPAHTTGRGKTVWAVLDATRALTYDPSARMGASRPGRGRGWLRRRRSHP
jgi:hypothetical protein